MTTENDRESNELEEYRGFAIRAVYSSAPRFDERGFTYARHVNHYVARASWDSRVWFSAQSIEEARKLIWEWWEDPSLEPGEKRRSK